MELLAVGAAAVALIGAEMWAAYGQWRGARAGADLNRRLLELLEVERERTTHEGTTNAELLERVEASERRVDAGLEDLARRTRKLGAERRRLEKAQAELEPDDEEEEAEAFLELFNRDEPAEKTHHSRRRMRRRSRGG